MNVPVTVVFVLASTFAVPIELLGSTSACPRAADDPAKDANAAIRQRVSAGFFGVERWGMVGFSLERSSIQTEWATRPPVRHCQCVNHPRAG
jgi:hypothetical protein